MNECLRTEYKAKKKPVIGGGLTKATEARAETSGRRKY
jgi:hypothetical protein